MELRWKFGLGLGLYTQKGLPVMWDSNIMLNFPMVAQSLYYVRICIHILYIAPLNPFLSDGVIHDLSVLIHYSSSNK